MRKRFVIAVSGATGVIFGIRLLEYLRTAEEIETHLILSHWAEQNILCETSHTVEDVRAMADYCYDNQDLGAKISSGSYPVSGMIIVPCSMKTLASVSCGLAETLISRCADVTLKERRHLILVPRETPLNTIHLENMLSLSRMGAHIVPPMPSFYHGPGTINDLLDHFTGRLLDLLDIPNRLSKRWDGLESV